jgi:hypothetical protein
MTPTLPVEGKAIVSLPVIVSALMTTIVMTGMGRVEKTGSVGALRMSNVVQVSSVTVVNVVVRMIARVPQERHACLVALAPVTLLMIAVKGLSVLTVPVAPLMRVMISSSSSSLSRVSLSARTHPA